VGLQQSTVVKALATAVIESPPALVKRQTGQKQDIAYPEAAKILSKALTTSTMSQVVGHLLAHPLASLSHTSTIQPGTPVAPMKAAAALGVDTALGKLPSGPFVAEFKYDGFRIQVHVTRDGDVHLYSRNLRDLNSMFPDVAARVNKWLSPHVRDIVFEGEVVPFSADAGLLPYNRLQKRPKKFVISQEHSAESQVDVCVVVFDLLHLNGESLVDRPLVERRGALREVLVPAEGEWMWPEHKEWADTDAVNAKSVQDLFVSARRRRCEGLVLKTLCGEKAKYCPDVRSMSWLKVKEDGLHIADTVDLVPIGAYFARGKRGGEYGSFLLACVASTDGRTTFQTVCKVGSGLTEAMTAKLREAHTIRQSRREDYVIGKGAAAQPDVWLEATCVLEVAASELTLSPLYTAAKGQVSGELGVSLRFPRVVRERWDKGVLDATTSEQIGELYRQQQEAAAE